LKVTLSAFVVALFLGVIVAVLFAQSRLFEISLFPYAVVLQVTPIVSIAPLTDSFAALRFRSGPGQSGPVLFLFLSCLDRDDWVLGNTVVEHP
jgi:ABC-type nitrate/sulfonate/bicarbonate transport system permease component